MKLLNKNEVVQWIDNEMWDTDDCNEEERQIALKWLWRVRDDITKGRVKEVKAIPIEWIEEWGSQNGMSESMSLAVMIEDWKKKMAKE